MLNHEARHRRNRLAHLGILHGAGAAALEILQRFDFKPLAAYGFAVTMVCQINGAILRELEKLAEPRQPRAAARAAEKAASRGSNPKKKATLAGALVPNAGRCLSGADGVRRAC